MEIFFGPSGLGGKDEAIENLKKYSKLGLKACEVAFTYGVYLNKSDAEEIGKEAKKLGIVLSIHAPYYINLNSDDKKKLFMSKKRILDCCEIGHYLSGIEKTRIVFHPGFYGKLDREVAWGNVKKQIVELMEEVKKNKWNVVLAPEVMGKINVFGSIEDISKLVEETGCGFCIDFAHVLARYKNHEFDLIKKSFPNKYWHCHFSGIVYGDKGEKNHRHTEKKEWEELFSFLNRLDKHVNLISEAPNPVGDAEEGFGIWKKI